MERFGLTSLDDLPPLEAEIAAQLAQAEQDATADGQDADEREAADDADRADSEVGEDEEPEFEGAPDPDV